MLLFGSSAIEISTVVYPTVEEPNTSPTWYVSAVASPEARSWRARPAQECLSQVSLLVLPSLLTPRERPTGASPVFFLCSLASSPCSGPVERTAGLPNSISMFRKSPSGTTAILRVLKKGLLAATP